MNTSVEIHVNGKAVRSYQHDGRTFVEAKTGSEYTIKVRNNTLSRVMAVVTVDGVNVINGNVTSEDDKVGYIVNGWNVVDIKGYRKDDSHVGAFKFTKKNSSYAKTKGIGHNTGVIGVRIYNEYQQPMMYPSFYNLRKSYEVYDEVSTSSLNSDVNSDMSVLRGSIAPQMKCCTYSSSVKDTTFDTGTTWGKKINDHCTLVEFKVGTLLESHSIYYASRESLEDLGIVFVQPKTVAYPDPFKPSFATPPKGWNG